MLKKLAVVLGMVLLQAVNMPASASSATESALEEDGPSGTDCFFQINRTKPECLGK